MAARSKSKINSKSLPLKLAKPAHMKSAPAKAGTLARMVKGAAKAIKAVKSAAKPAPKAATKAMAKPTVTKAAPVAQSSKGAKLANSAKTHLAAPVAVAPSKGRKSAAEKQKNSAAAAVEKVTERLMGRVVATPLFDTVCREVACEGLGTSAGYCRLHYIKNWRKIKRKEVILKEGKLNQYIEELVAKYPEKYIEAIRQDLANDKEFAKVIVDLDLDENDEDFEGEGSGDNDTSIDSIKREFEDETETF